jgi:hypothetical protein
MEIRLKEKELSKDDLIFYNDGFSVYRPLNTQNMAVQVPSWKCGLSKL